jgi:16S rRNA (guanine527-N7)-methyltransferase
VFGSQFGAACQYADRLATDGVVMGLIGPREVPRLWERHLLNSAAVAQLVPQGVRVIDVGSGAGLPGIPLALCRPDLQVELVEPMLRRTSFLDDVVKQLQLSTVGVIRARAPEVLKVVGAAPVVTARALAPLDRLVRWCLPLVEPGGALLAVKGETAAAELAQHGQNLKQLGVAAAEVVTLEVTGSRTWVVALTRSGHQTQRKG